MVSMLQNDTSEPKKNNVDVEFIFWPKRILDAYWCPQKTGLCFAIKFESIPGKVRPTCHLCTGRWKDIRTISNRNDPYTCSIHPDYSHHRVEPATRTWEHIGLTLFLSAWTLPTRNVPPRRTRKLWHTTLGKMLSPNRLNSKFLENLMVIYSSIIFHLFGDDYNILQP